MEKNYKNVSSFEIQSKQELILDIDEHQQKEHRHDKSIDTENNKKASDFQCLMISIKLFFGLSYLSIPNTFSLGGVIGGTVMLTVVVCLNLITMMQVLSVGNQHPGVKSYSELGYKVFGKRGKVLVDLCICITQLSCCIAYQYFTASSIDFILCQASNNNHCYGNRLFLILIMIPVIFLSFLSSYKALSYLSIPSVIIAVMGIITIFSYSIDKIKTNEQEPFEDIQWFNLSAVLGRVGIAMHIFSGNPSILNIQSEARNKKRYPTLLKLGVLFLLILYSLYGTVSYIAYREKTQPIFIMSMVPMDKFIYFVFLCFAFNSMTSYPVQILTAFQIVEKLELYQNIHAPYHLKRYLSRTLIIISVTCISLIVPNFTDFLNISGSVGATFSCFVIPQLLYMSQYKETIKLYEKIGCIMLLLIGISGSVFSIHFTINRIIHGDNH
ncbi:UNKNOWN [Stylonychia lemnae]|uniref:Amino acid transporter transmembrane domain-containing protein n=1 Tax=Stylonychia lemnae TaxID=5949 RepID=A0A078AMV0_STYLE|nr:UNKNOWN [Stylonychia lemnae]|eukprot:CDW82702.1 UNKNOWN [Stylonychia lemnae]